MSRAIWPALFLGLLTTFVPRVSASFGFTSASFNYVQLSSPQIVSWNGQSGQVELRLMRYPADAELSYLPIAANLTGDSYTWIPTSLAPSSQWTLEAIDGQGNIAASGNPFAVQGGAATATSNAVSTSFKQQNPQSTAQPTAIATSPSTTSQATTSSSPSSTNDPTPPSNHRISMGVKIGIFFGLLLGVGVIVGLVMFLVLRHRQKQGKSLFGSKKRSNSSLPFELQDNESVETLQKPMELQGSRVEGTSETSYGSRVELGWGASSRKSVGKRISIADGAVETSMGKRMELG